MRIHHSCESSHIKVTLAAAARGPKGAIDDSSQIALKYVPVNAFEAILVTLSVLGTALDEIRRQAGRVNNFRRRPLHN
jgi:hypothetical protein